MNAEQQPSLQRFLDPTNSLENSYKRIYENGEIKIGRSSKDKQYAKTARENTVAIVGGALGDEGKGRFVDNVIEDLLSKKDIENVYVVRFQGGNNAGHTVEKEGRVLKLHLLPSGVFYKEAIGIIDSGVVVHPEDLATEAAYVEKEVGDIRERIVLSDTAILATDLERAEEYLNNHRSGKSKGGTGRGIAPAYAHHLDRRGFIIRDLIDKNWDKTLGEQYDQYATDLHAYGLNLKDVPVPDFSATLLTGKDQKRNVGSKNDFLSRLNEARDWIIEKNIVRDTLPLHHAIYSDDSAAVVFEGAQAAGLDAWLGTRPDVTASNTRVYGISEGTGFWKREDVMEAIAVIKVPYTSSVGSRIMPTHIDLPKDKDGLPSPLGKDATRDQSWAEWIRKTGHEYGTTTGRARDINHLDLPFLTYNLRMSGADCVAVTHLDLSRETDTVKIGTHYENQNGEVTIYQPDLEKLKHVKPQYLEIPGWNGEETQKASKLSELPENSLKFLSFLQDRIGYPIIATTTGPGRENYISFS